MNAARTVAFTPRAVDGRAYPRGDLPLVLRYIAVFKFLQALTLCAVALAAFQMLRPEIAVLVQDWVEQLPITGERNAVEHFFGWATGLASNQVLGIGIGALLYASLFLLEGVGLWRRKTWAEWLTVVATSLPIPLEVYEVVRHLSPLRVLALVGNVVVVWLLVSHLRRLALSRVKADIRPPTRV